jgi:hypothetical protein
MGSVCESPTSGLAAPDRPHSGHGVGGPVIANPEARLEYEGAFIPGRFSTAVCILSFSLPSSTTAVPQA